MDPPARDASTSKLAVTREVKKAAPNPKFAPPSVSSPFDSG